jgi:hypothetical protein
MSSFTKPLVGLLALAAVAAWDVRITQPVHAGTQERGRDGLVLVGRVQQVHSPRLVAIENRLSDEQHTLVLIPEGAAAPVAGSLVQATGVLRRLDRTSLDAGAWRALERAAQSGFAGRPVLIATVVEPAVQTGRDVERPPLPAPVQASSKREITVRPEALASLIEELAGFTVRVPYARVVGLFDSRSFLVDSAMRLRPSPGHRDRILVLVDDAALRVPAETLVASTVTVEGVARTLLGMQVTREAPWPSLLDPDRLKRLDVRAAVLATSVRTAEGVELTDK